MQLKPYEDGTTYTEGVKWMCGGGQQENANKLCSYAGVPVEVWHKHPIMSTGYVYLQQQMLSRGENLPMVAFLGTFQGSHPFHKRQTLSIGREAMDVWGNIKDQLKRPTEMVPSCSTVMLGWDPLGGHESILGELHTTSCSHHWNYRKMGHWKGGGCVVILLSGL